MPLLNILCLVYWLYFFADSCAIHFAQDEIRLRVKLKAFVVYSWVASLAGGIVTLAFILIQEVLI